MEKNKKRHPMEKERCTTKYSDKSEACLTWKGEGNGLNRFGVHAKEKQ